MSNFDEALERFHLVGLEYAGALANHGPMAAQALVDLGHQALIPAFVDRYAPRLPPALAGRALRGEEESSARGDFARAADWIATFEAQLERGNWTDRVRAAMPTLLPGLFAGAGHGLLRTVHAMRALEQEDTPLRRRELARGLAYWSARHRRLPGLPGTRPPAKARSAAADADPAALRETAATLPFAPAHGESLSEAISRLEGFTPYREAVECFSMPDEAALDGFLARLCRVGARLYLGRPDARLAYAHAVTIPAAMRWLAPRIAPGDACAGAAFAYQAVAALHALYGGAPLETTVDDEVAKTAESWDEIRYRAACSIEEHAIKLTEACFREDRAAPDPILALAAADAALRIDGSRSRILC
jgi:hypothetical protein